MANGVLNPNDGPYSLAGLISSLNLRTPEDLAALNHFYSTNTTGTTSDSVFKMQVLQRLDAMERMMQRMQRDIDISHNSRNYTGSYDPFRVVAFVNGKNPLELQPPLPHLKDTDVIGELDADAVAAYIAGYEIAVPEGASDIDKKMLIAGHIGCFRPCVIAFRAAHE